MAYRPYNTDLLFTEGRSVNHNRPTPHGYSRSLPYKLGKLMQTDISAEMGVNVVYNLAKAVAI